MIRIGAVNPDTSHFATFAKYLHDGQRARYTAIYNDGLRDDAAIDKFITDFQLEKRCRTLDELVDFVDVGFVHSCNWEQHLRLAEPFIKKGKPVFIDKPIVGSLSDCRKLEAFAESGAVILGSSSLRYCYEVREFLDKPEAERGQIVSVIGTVGTDEFNYGIHVVEMIGGLVGTGAIACRCVGSGEVDGRRCETFFIRFDTGLTAIYNNFHAIHQPFTATIMTTKTTFQFAVDSKRLYMALLDQVLNRLENKPNILADVPALLESVKIMLAGRLSRARGGVEVKLADIPDDDPGFDGAAFERFYAKR
ncbi:MAG: Gfo/Idh/MocA family oxidoreductase [Kiritimatiellia bacterium]|jgi:hypothetical protein